MWSDEVLRLRSPPGNLGMALLQAELQLDWKAWLDPSLQYSPAEWREYGTQGLKDNLSALWRMFADAVNDSPGSVSEAVHLTSQVTAKSKQLGLYFAMQPKYKWHAREMCGAITYGVAKRNVNARYRKPTKKQRARTTTPRAEEASRGVLPQCGLPRKRHRRA